MSRLRGALPALLAALLPAAVYLRTAAPGLTPIDAGELAAVATTLGVAHPPGYPLFTLLGHVWTWLPLPGPPIQRLNFFAAALVAVAAAWFYQCVRWVLAWVDSPPPLRPAAAPAGWRPTRAEIVGLSAAWTFAFARTVWQQATAIEVYALQLALVLGSLWLVLRATLTTARGRGPWLLWAFTLGLTFSNHLTAIWLAPALAQLVLWRLGWRAPAWRLIGWMTPFFLLGLTPYLYLPLRSAAVFPFHNWGPPDFDWGGVGRGWGAFVDHVTGQQYQVWFFSGIVGAHVRRLFLLLPYQVAVLGLLLLPVGLWRLWRERRRLLVWLALLALAPLGYALSYDIFDIDAYFLTPFIGLILLAAVGLHVLVRRREAWAWAALALPAAALVANWSAADRSGDQLIPEHVTNVTAHLEPNAVLLSGEWEFFDSAFWYLQRVEGVRPDIALVNLHLLRRSWYPAQLARWRPDLLDQLGDDVRLLVEQEQRFERGAPHDDAVIEAHFVGLVEKLIARQIASRPVYITPGLLREKPTLAQGYEPYPAGFALRLIRPGQRPPPLVNRFRFDQLIAAPIEQHDVVTRALVQESALAVERTYAYARFLGAEDEARRLANLYGRLAPKVQR